MALTPPRSPVAAKPCRPGAAARQAAAAAGRSAAVSTARSRGNDQSGGGSGSSAAPPASDGAVGGVPGLADATASDAGLARQRRMAMLQSGGGGGSQDAGGESSVSGQKKCRCSAVKCSGACCLEHTRCGHVIGAIVLAHSPYLLHGL